MPRRLGGGVCCWCCCTSARVLLPQQVGFSPLYLAVARGCVSTTSTILEYFQQHELVRLHAAPDATKEMQHCVGAATATARLSDALTCKHFEVGCTASFPPPPRLLLAKDCLVDPPSIQDGWTPLHAACFYGHARIAHLLVDAGAPVNAVGESHVSKAGLTVCSMRVPPCTTCDAQMSTPLLILCERQSPHQGAVTQCELCSVPPFPPMSNLRNEPPEQCCCRPCVETPRHETAVMDRRSTPACLAVLLAAGADVSTENAYGENALLVAVTAIPLSSLGDCNGTACVDSDSGGDCFAPSAEGSEPLATPVPTATCHAYGMVADLLTHVCHCAAASATAIEDRSPLHSSSYAACSLQLATAACRVEIAAAEALASLLQPTTDGDSRRIHGPVLWSAAEAGCESAVHDIALAVENRIAALDACILSLALRLTSKAKGRTFLPHHRLAPHDDAASGVTASSAWQPPSAHAELPQSHSRLVATATSRSFMSPEDQASACITRAKVTRARLVETLEGRFGLMDEVRGRGSGL